MGLAGIMLAMEDKVRGEEIKRLRKLMGLSQEKFAVELGLAGGNVSISRWESGKVKPSRLSVKAIKELRGRIDGIKDTDD